MLDIKKYLKQTKTVLVTQDAFDELVKKASAQPEPKWIPCKECMPEVGDYVICSQENGDVGEGKLLPDGNWLILYESAEYGIRWVTAWMPLPSVYREEGD